jgi:hypothetical protein
VINTCLAEIRMTWAGQQVENTTYWDFGEEPLFADMTALATALANWWSANIADLVSDQVRIREVTVTSLDSATGPQANFVPPTFIDGALESPSLPNINSLSVSFRTALRGRSFRGRNYVVGLTESQVTDNTVDVPTTEGYQAAYTALRTGATASIAAWSVVSRYSGVDPVTKKPIPRVEGIATPITSVVIVDPIIDGQRRRLPSRGQ